MGIGTLLLERGLITRVQLEQALAEQSATGERLDRVLVRLKLVTPDQVLHAIGDQFHMPVVDMDTVTVEPEVLAVLPAKLVYRQNCVPIERSNGTLTVATSDPFELSVLDELRLLTGCTIDLVLADEEQLHKFIRANYGVGGDTLDELTGGDSSTETSVTDATETELEQAQEASVIKLVNDLIFEAVSERATDVHIEPYENELIVRYRIDGLLQKANVPPTIYRFGAAIISRIKIMSNLNIAEKRKPQDGRISIRHRIGGTLREFDLRVSIIPMLFGEGVVLRILDKTTSMLTLNDLGMEGMLLDKWDELIERPHGIVLVTGPTGSGKSTTLYASLSRIVTEEIKVVTVEDPVEYHLSGVNQIQVNNKVGLNFAHGLRSVLRHDPDVVMIGEIRDRETAEIAVRASLTGHLVLSTLHTNDAAGSTTRLLDMGIEPFLVASSVEGILAQRLVRRICDQCAVDEIPDRADLPEDFPLTAGQTLRRGAGCRACRNTGFRGRLGIFELLVMSDSVRDMVMHRANAREIAAKALADGDLTLLKQNGYDIIRDGKTTMSEVAKALTA